MDNLAIAFPEKTLVERKKIAKNFYKQFVDTFIEVIKLLSISAEELDKRFQCNYDAINDLYSQYHKVNLVSGHFFNWELANLAYSKNLKYIFIGAYTPIENKVFDKLFRALRGRFGAKLVSARNFREDFQQYAKEKYVLGLIADQNATNTGKAYWVDFFGKKAPFVRGPEKSSKLGNVAIAVCNYYPVKRGYYKSDLKILTLHPKELAEGVITKNMIAFIEETIRQHPSSYLWSHRRWKWEYNEEVHGRQAI